MRKVILIPIPDTYFETEKIPAVYFDYDAAQWNTHHAECQCIECRDTEPLR